MLAKRKWSIAIGLLILFVIIAYLVFKNIQQDSYATREQVAQSRSISKNELLEFDGRALVLSNSPEFVHGPGIMCRVDNAVSENGKVRVFYSHLNLLTNPSNPEENVPAKIGFVMANQTGRKIDVMYERKALVHSIDSNGKTLIEPNPTPKNPANGSQNDYGGRPGMELVKQWMESGIKTKEPQLLVTLAPGEKNFIYETVGKRGWGMGMFDLVLVDHDTKKPVIRKELPANEGFLVQVFAAPENADVQQFYVKSQTEKMYLPGDNVISGASFHHRGLFLPGVYPSAPKGEGVTRYKTVTYDPAKDGNVNMQVHNSFRHQYQQPDKPFYMPEMYQNDTMKNGVDDYGVKEINGKKTVEKMVGQDNGEYGADYIFTLHLKGPTQIAIQAAGWNLSDDTKAPVDIYDQFFAVEWDQKEVQTVHIKDPNIERYYTDFSKLSRPGLVKVIKTIAPGKDGETHTLHVMVSPNGYGPFRIHLMPVEK